MVGLLPLSDGGSPDCPLDFLSYHFSEEGRNVSLPLGGGGCSTPHVVPKNTVKRMSLEGMEGPAPYSAFSGTTQSVRE